jgi:hypothetical protein
MDGRVADVGATTKCELFDQYPKDAWVSVTVARPDQADRPRGELSAPDLFGTSLKPAH